VKEMALNCQIGFVFQIWFIVGSPPTQKRKRNRKKKKKEKLEKRWKSF
jgi:hypothetical protein